MTQDPYREASKYNTAVKRVRKWRDAFIIKIESQCVEKEAALFAALSPAARRIVHAAMDIEIDSISARDADAEPAIPARLLEPVAPPAPGSVVEVDEEARMVGRSRGRR
jgi:hypothetical protein